MSLQDRSAGRTFAIGGNIQFPRFRCCVSANCKYPNGAEAPGDSGHFTAVACCGAAQAAGSPTTTVIAQGGYSCELNAILTLIAGGNNSRVIFS
jgi:hypothetical protein